MTASTPREPRVFAPDDPALVSLETGAGEPGNTPAAPSSRDGEDTRGRTPGAASPKRRLTWAGVLLSAGGSLLVLAAGLWLARFVSIALERDDAIGWIAFLLLALAGLAASMLAVREVVGFLRLGRLGDVRREIEAARGAPLAEERAAVRRLRSLFASRAELAWPLARLMEHERGVGDAGDLLRLAERELVAPLDREARRRIMASAKRVGVVTALSPSGVLSVMFVLYENLRLLRAIAALYGGRPGTLGGLKLARMVVVHIVATSGIALTDDLLGQFLGQDALRRVSRRLGEGAFNGALTARIGVAAIHVCRPMPFLEAQPVRLRDLLPELFRRLRAVPAAGERPPARRSALRRRAADQ